MSGYLVLAVGLVFLIGSLGLNGYLLKERAKNIGEGEYLVSRVVDGDTLILGPQNMRVRLGNVEAPELIFCGGKEAKV